MMVKPAELILLYVIGLFGIISFDATYARKIPEDCSVCGEMEQNNCKVQTYPFIRGESYANSSCIFPWMVSLRSSNNSNICAGAIIDKSHILTAAHCVKDPTTGNLNYHLKVFFQAPSVEGLSKGFAIEAIYVPTGYRIKHPNTTGILVATYDIALVKLEQEIKCDEYKSPICLPDADFKLPEGSEGIIAGWNSSKLQTEQQTDVLQYGVVKKLDFRECIKAAPPVNEIKHQSVCVGGTKETLCYADPGGPLMHQINQNYYVVGVLSTETDTSCAIGSPAVYTDVVEFLSFINRYVAPIFVKERKQYETHRLSRRLLFFTKSHGTKGAQGACG